MGEGETQIVNLNLQLRLIACHSVENIIGGGNNDVFIGNSLDNRFTGLNGNDTMTGEGGNDTYIFDGDLPLGSDTINEADDIEGGIDTLDFSDTTGFPMNINLSDDTPPAQIVSANLDLQLSADDSIENVLGGQAGNTLTGNSLNNVLVGGPATDSLVGGAGDDTLEGRGGIDALDGGVGNDTYILMPTQISAQRPSSKDWAAVSTRSTFPPQRPLASP